MTEKTNILLILTDQHRVDTLGCYGAGTCRTPNLDRLASRGVRFDRAYTNCSPCSPSRAALFTGLYPHHNHVYANGQQVNPEAPTLAGELQAAGYALGYAGKWHVDDPKTPSEYGFRGKDFPGYGYPVYEGLVEGLRFGPRAGSAGATTHYRDYLAAHGYDAPTVLEAHYGDNPGTQGQEMYALQSGRVEQSFEYMVSEDTIDLLRQFRAEQEAGGGPFFMWTNFWGPHTPCFIPEPYYSMYDPAAIPEEPSFGETWAHKPYVQQLVERYWGLSAGGWARWREIVARYWGYVTMLDDLVGRILAELEALGLAENTLVVFGTDHGDNMGAHRLIEKGPFMHEECYRLPLIAAHPQCQAPGSACDEFVYLQDLFPTLLDLAGRPAPAAPDTRSIMGLVRGEESPTGRESIYAQFFDQIFPFEQRMIRTRRHKLVYNRTDTGELYDMAADPHEMVNLFGRPEVKAIQEELMDQMRAHMVRLGDPILGPFDRIRAVY